MSSIKLKHSGGNAVSLHPPTSAPSSSDVQFKLPTTDGSAGQVLQTDGSGNLSWVTPGKLLQVQTTQTNAQSNLTLTNAYSLYDTPLTVDITSAAANSKFIISALLNGEGNAPDHNFGIVLRRTIAGSGTSLSVGQASGGNAQSITRTLGVGYHADDNDSTTSATSIPAYLDAPAQAAGTTINYKIAIMELGGTANRNIWFNRPQNNSTGGGYERTASYITIQEIAA